jgi:hypothetical protein
VPHSVPRAERPGQSDRHAYRERLTVPWWSWPLAAAAGAVAGAELSLGAPDLRLPAITVGVVLATVGLARLGRIRIEVDADELRVDDARLPLRFVADAHVVEPEERRELLGPGSHPLAFVILRPWVRRAVRIDLDDPADPTPYWLISSRRPAALVDNLSRGRATAAVTDP